mmetsp:Transcript_88393/g.230368  ORF Transcript_88393/g.230368 Transcript_88393/m.230368 type:complete len:128 (+) Transcript_88393:72-455(+)
MVGPFSARGLSDGVMTTALSAAAMSAFDAPSAGKPATSDDDEGDVSTVDVCSRRASSESEEEQRPETPGRRARPALEAVLAALPHFEDARSGAEEDDSDDEDIVLRVGQLARRLALGCGADECPARK